MIYLDTSAIVKLVVKEPESPALHDYLSAHPERVSSALARVELTRALRRAERSESTLERAAAVLQRLALVPLDDIVLEAAARVEPVALRSLDALHLATALSLPPLAAFVAYDERLLAAARGIGLAVAAPG